MVSGKATLSQLRVMVIDDDELMLDLVSMNLTRLGISTVTSHSDGREALAEIDRGERFDVLILDLNMPNMDGIEVLRNLAIREFAGGILLFSSEDARILKAAQSLASAHRLNVLGSLQKPVSADDLEPKLAGYKPISNETRPKPVELVTPEELHDAIRNRQIVPFFQPKARVVDRSLDSAEVLARWHHRKRGLLPPIAFISVAEEHDLIDELTWVVFEQAIRRLGEWRQAGYEFSLGMNLSADSLATVDLPERLAGLASANDVPCETIELEITETRLMQNLTTALDVLARLRLRGFRLSIDDFGTGYSSMSQLSNIPFTELKIDRAFVHGASEDPAALAILESSVSLATKLGMTVVAEGVEDQSDWDQVAQVGCNLVQGYFVAKPMPADEFEVWFKEHDSLRSNS